MGERHTGERFMLLLIDGFYIEQDKIGILQRGFYLVVEEIAGCIGSGMQRFRFAKFKKIFYIFGLSERFAAGMSVPRYP